MGNKFISWSIVILLGLSVIAIIVWTVIPTFAGNYIETYMRVGLLFLGVITFGILRIYNAILGNTRFLIKLRETLRPMNHEMILLKSSLMRMANRVNKNTDISRTVNDTLKEVNENLHKVKTVKERNNLKK